MTYYHPIRNTKRDKQRKGSSGKGHGGHVRGKSIRPNSMAKGIEKIIGVAFGDDDSMFAGVESLNNSENITEVGCNVNGINNGVASK